MSTRTKKPSSRAKKASQAPKVIVSPALTQLPRGSGVEVAVASLTGKPVALDVAKLQLPRTGGLYAWWIVGRIADADGEALPGVPANKHPLEADLDLLYVGIAPNGPDSKATLRSRVVGNHMGGNIAASTLRRTLASLLIDQLELTPIKKGTKVVLPKIQNTLLSTWQKDHLRLTWHATPQPWLIESAVIEALRPPLNLADNETHPFHKTLSDARRTLKQAAEQPSD